MIAIKLSEKIMAKMPECCGECVYFGSRPHPYKGWTDLCELCCQCLDDDQEDGWIYDGDSRPKNCPFIEVSDETKEAEPVRHGKWTRDYESSWGDSRFMCSVCHCKESVPTCNGEPSIWDYCPNCGCKMDLDEVNDE